MTDIDTLLALGIVVAVSINALTSLYVVRRLQPIQIASENGEGRETDEDDEDDEDEPAEAGLPTKEEILARRSQLIRELEEERGSKVLTLIHRKEPWSASDEEPEIVLEDSEVILQQVRETPPDKPIDFIIHTEGGLAFAADLIAMALKYHPGKVTVMIPFYALSDGTYIVLAADEIMMEKCSILAPCEPIIADMQANLIMGILKRKPIETISDGTILLAEAARMDTDNARQFVKWLLSDKLGDDQATQVAGFLTGGFMASSTPITLDVVRAIGLNVVEGVPEKVMQLFETIEFGGGKVNLGKQYR
jgi:ClpP class serine protease